MNAAAEFAGDSTPSQVIGRYLSRLAQASIGLDPALVNDMLADAEQHLWNAVADGVPAAQAAAEFGDPAEVVAGYVRADRAGKGDVHGESHRTAGENAAAGAATIGTSETTMPGSDAAHGDPWKRGLADPPLPQHRFSTVPVVGVWFDRYAWGSLGLFLIGFVLATVTFTIVVTWASLAGGLVVLIIGLPMLVALLGFCRFLALLHGRLIEVTTGVRMPRRSAPVAGTGLASFWGRVKLWLSDGRSWLSVAFVLGNYPVAVALFSLFIALLSTSLVLMVAPFAHAVLPDELKGDGTWKFGVWQGNNLPLLAGALLTILGVVLMTGTLWLAKGCGWLYAQVVKAIQVSRPVAAVR